MKRLSPNLTPTEQRLDNGDRPAVNPSVPEMTQAEFIERFGYPEGLDAIDLTISRVADAVEGLPDQFDKKLAWINDVFGEKLDRISRSLEILTHPKPPAGFSVIVIGRIDKDSDPMMLACGTVLA